MEFKIHVIMFKQNEIWRTYGQSRDFPVRFLTDFFSFHDGQSKDFPVRLLNEFFSFLRRDQAATVNSLVIRRK